MKFALIIIVIIFGANILNAQEIDTLAIKQEVSSLKTFNDKKSYLKNIYERDQFFRGARTNDSIDWLNLISIAYFVNEFGYPEKIHFDQYSSVPSLVWVHNKYREIDKIAFPILLKGLFRGEIKERDLRTYYLRGLYNYKFDDPHYNTLPLKRLFEICEVNLGDTLSIKALLEQKAEIEKFEQLEVVRETQWESGNTQSVYELNGETINVEHEGKKISIIYRADGRIFLLSRAIDRSGEPIELEKIAANRYKYKHQNTNKYFEFQEDKILFKDSQKLIKAYLKTDTNPNNDVHGG